jgi:hypothetical protein
LFEWGSHSYPYDYAGYDFIRGHEYDNWRTAPITFVPPWAERLVEHLGDAAQSYLRNVQHFQREEDFFAPQVLQTTADWRDRNHTQPQFFLHVDCFDVHEPFHVPEPYRSLYTDDDGRCYSPWPLYGRVDDGRSALDAAELDWVRAQFAGKLTMVDTWLARVFERLDRYNLWERTCVIVTTDHGHYLGDHGWIGKPDAPLHHTLCHVPLLVWHLHGAHNGKRIDATTQTVDLYATVLDLLGTTPPQGANIHSRSFAPVLVGHQAQHRDYAVYAYNNHRVGATMGDWTLLRDHDATQSPAYWYPHQVDQLHGRSVWMRGNRPHVYPRTWKLVASCRASICPYGARPRGRGNGQRRTRRARIFCSTTPQIRPRSTILPASGRTWWTRSQRCCAHTPSRSKHRANSDYNCACSATSPNMACSTMSHSQCPAIMYTSWITYECCDGTTSAASHKGAIVPPSPPSSPSTMPPRARAASAARRTFGDVALVDKQISTSPGQR